MVSNTSQGVPNPRCRSGNAVTRRHRRSVPTSIPGQRSRRPRPTSSLLMSTVTGKWTWLATLVDSILTGSDFEIPVFVEIVQAFNLSNGDNGVDRDQGPRSKGLYRAQQ